MFSKILIYIKNFDWILFLPLLLLMCFGLAEIYSISLGRDSLDLLNFKKQVLFILVGLSLFFLFSFLDYHFLRSYGTYIYIFGIIALLAVVVFGETIRGTRGWLMVGSFGIQVVEFIKIILIVFLARFFSSISMRTRPIKHLLISGLGAFVFIIFILFQPDFGSALLLIAIWVAMIFFAGFDKKYFIVVILLFALLVGGAWLFLFKDYQKQRILTFINPSSNPLQEGYNISQAMIAVGSGGITGRGIGFGSQSQLKFLPEAQNDFIFAVIAEELGFLGVMLLLLFYSVFFFRALSMIKHINNDFGVFFILGAVSLIFIQMFINIGMNMGMLPVVGISLPFVSYGGSALLSSLIIAGIMESIIIRSKINY
jgi:rod shape determining protein RodA